MKVDSLIPVTLFVLTALSLTAAASRAADSASEADKTFVGKVSQGGMYEVEASKLAAKQATAADVKDQAMTEVHDHEGVNKRLKKIAETAGLTVSADLNSEFADRLAKLKAVKSADFDAAYIEDMKQIHDKDEKLFAKEAEEGTGEFKSFAHETDLIVKRHIGFSTELINTLCSAGGRFPARSIHSIASLQMANPTLALYAHLKPKTGKTAEVEAFLKSALPLAENEPGTITWYAFDEDGGGFGIFDTFETEAARQAHLDGPIAKALMAKASELLAEPPKIHKIRVLAAKTSK